MNRERKLLYAVAILAPIVEGLMFAQWYQPEIPGRQAYDAGSRVPGAAVPGLGGVPSGTPPQGRYLAD
jgi:hypothetical protein